MDRVRISAAAILILCMFIVINNSSTIRAADHEGEVETSKPSFSEKLRNLVSFSTSSPVSTSYWGKLKSFMKQAHAHFFPPNTDFRSGGGGGEEVSNGGGSAGKKVKEAVAKSMKKSKATVEGSAKSAATVAKEKLKKSFSSQPPHQAEL